MVNPFLQDDRLMNNEWNAWQDVVKLWPGDMNDETKWGSLVRAIVRWGEELSALRATQDATNVKVALNDARQKARKSTTEIIST